MNRVDRSLGAHLEANGVRFAVWAPNAERVSVVGDFNAWQGCAHPLSKDEKTGIWSGFAQGVTKGARYNYRVWQADGACIDKTDPVGFYFEPAPNNASIVWDLDFSWSDAAFAASRLQRQAAGRPMSIYEMHLGSWKKGASYRDLARELPSYLQSLGFTHVEFQPVMEHPFYGSWGYQTTGYFAPTSRYGSPQDFMALIDALHAAGILVILDWSCAHFASDDHGLARFDGTHLYEHAHPFLGVHPDWGSLIFNYGRYEVADFLVSSALFWLERYHIDGLRVDAVASMLYLDYSRKPGEWIANQHGGNENLEALAFLKTLNSCIKAEVPGALCIAEESTTWPHLTKRVEDAGVGFDMKWDMGWMHDTLAYFNKDPVHRQYHQDQLVFRSHYAFNERYLLALSHDEVVHQKHSLIAKMPGDYMQGFANLRCLLAYQFALPGKKLLFMGTELAPFEEWSHEASLPFELLNEAAHSGVHKLIKDLNGLYQRFPALHANDFEREGFLWLDHSDHQNSVMSFARRGSSADEPLICVFNFTPVARHNYRIPALSSGRYEEVLNTDSHFYGGFGFGNLGEAPTHPIECQGWPESLCLVLPPLSALFLRWKEDA